MRISSHFPHSLLSNAARHFRRQSLMLACAAIAVLPLAWRGTSCGHDFDFHLQSWLEVTQHWHEGILYPHWDASANYGAGEPRFVFYPPLTWVLGALLGTILPWNWTPIVFTMLAFLACGFSFFAMAHEWIPENAAAVSTCIYLLNPYLLFVAYERTAYGELLSAALLPLLVLYGLRKEPTLSPLSLTIAALWLINAPSAVMGCYFLAWIVLTAAIRDRSYTLITRTAGAVTLGLGLAAFYIVPAFFEQRWVEIARAIAPGMRVEDSFLFGHTGESYHDQVLHTASWIAVAMLITTAIAGWRARQRSTLRLTMTATAFLILLLLFPFSTFLWKHTPELKFLQFPWRWLLVLAVAMSALIGLALGGKIIESKTRKGILVRVISMLTLAVILSSFAAYFFWQPCDEEDNIAAQRATFRSGGFEGTDEYTAINSDNGGIQQELPLVRVLKSPDADQADSSVVENPEWKPVIADAVPAQAQIKLWKSETKQFVIDLPANAYAVLKLIDYPAWLVLVNGNINTVRPHRDDGLMTIPLRPGRSVISIHYAATRDVELGRALSLLALCIVIALYAQTKRRRMLQVS